MIHLTTGNLLEAQVEALVNTVNCVGVMGKGIALQFKQAFPENFKQYKKACDQGEVEPGRMLVTKTGQLQCPHFIINFPTKRHWRNNSKLEDIESGLVALVKEIEQLQIGSIAIPPLGCGNGGLDWGIVRPMIEEALAPLTRVEIYLYEPKGAPAAAEIPIAPKNLKMTPARALLIKLIDQYRSQDYRLTRLEMQKLAYFLQEAGQPLKLRYEKHQYGPYAHNLNHILQRMDGEYIRGYGDGSQASEIYPLPEALEAANRFLADDLDAQRDLNKVSELIYGFETPFGMELLATTHWVVTQEQASDIDTIYQHVLAWNDRKKERYSNRFHIEKAFEQLKSTRFI